MNANPTSSDLLNSSIFIIFILVTLASISHCEDDDGNYYEECKGPFTCGNLTDLSYPFWGGGRPSICGLEEFKLSCGQAAIMTMKNQDYRVVSVNRTGRTMAIARLDFWNTLCPQDLKNTTLNSPFNFAPGVENITLYNYCAIDTMNKVKPGYKFECRPTISDGQSFYATDKLLSEWELQGPQCNQSVYIPVQSEALRSLIEKGGQSKDLQNLLREGFNVSYSNNGLCQNCEKSYWFCGTSTTTRKFTCFCPLEPEPYACPAPPVADDPNIKLKVGIGFGASFGTIILMLIGFCIYLRRKKKGPYAPTSYVSQSNTSDFSSKSDLEIGGSHLGVHLFSYAELEKATNNFDSSKELGEGGFGTVYYGKLRDGRTVAVKRLYENNYKRVEQFMNEVHILTRLRHPNLVSLYGCTSRHCRELLLVYEFISNGTVADHLHGERAKPGELPWSTRVEIAVETASALTYLHASDIIHRDVKTNNILLDDNFCVKVADFGLSRLFPTHVTHVSTAPQGTPGYVDPEYHECYQLTDKSDVYSFGVVLMELISSMPAVDITRHRHEINLSNMAINKIQSGAVHELVDRNLGYDTDYRVRKMVNAVAELAFQCLQSAKEIRPTIKEVLQSLKEIQSKDYKLEEEEETEDDVGLLKNGPVPLSPDTVVIKWTSSSTTPNTSG